MTTFQEIPPAEGDRIIDIGGLCGEEDEEGAGSGRNLVIFAVDPGITSGWSALKVPVARLGALGVTRTLARCRWRHGQILRSGVGVGRMAEAVSDSRHVTLILEQARAVYEEFVFVPSEDDPEDWEEDSFVFVVESFSLRMMSMDTNLLAPVRVTSMLLDRMWARESDLPVFFQNPADAKRTVTDQRLRTWAMYDSGSGPHARDADRHAILFLRRFAESQGIRSSLGF